MSSASNEAASPSVLVSSNVSSLSSLLSTNTIASTPNSSSGDDIFNHTPSSSDHYSMMPQPPANPLMSQLAKRLSQPPVPLNRPGPSNSPQQLRNLLQRPISSVCEGMLVTKMSGTPISTTKVWVPGMGPVSHPRTRRLKFEF